MNILFIVGRIAFVLIFILSGTQKLFDISGTAAMIESKLVVPPILIDLETKLQGLTGMPLPRLLAIVAGVVEIGGGLMIAANVGTRIAAVALIVFPALATYLFHDFWAMTGADRTRYELGANEAGLVVTSVEPTSDAAQKGIGPGDVILQAGGRPVRTPQDLTAAANAARAAGRPLLLQLDGPRGRRFIAADVGEG